jgi:hypothetical protein
MTKHHLLKSFALTLVLSSSAAAADLCGSARFQCNGFEPNWQFTTALDEAGNPVVRFLDPENPGWEEGPLVVGGCVLQGSPNDFEVTSQAPVSLLASIVGQSCTEPNDDLTDFSVTVTFDQGALTSSPNRVEGNGCCKRLD